VKIHAPLRILLFKSTKAAIAKETTMMSSRQYPQFLLLGDSIIQNGCLLRDGFCLNAGLAERRFDPGHCGHGILLIDSILNVPIFLGEEHERELMAVQIVLEDSRSSTVAW